MNEIDLIPRDYRNWLGQKRVLRNGVILFVAINALVLAGGAWLSHSVAKGKALATQLQADNAITQQQQLQLQQMKDQQSTYEQQLALLQGLRAGAAIEDIFTLIDRSLVADRLWFLDWGFRRAGIIVDGQRRTYETGYFIIVGETNDAAKKQNLEVETRMTIHGQATDHQALSSFVRALFEQPDVRDVNVQRTSSINLGARRAVEFNITVILHSEYRGA